MQILILISIIYILLNFKINWKYMKLNHVKILINKH